MTALRDAGRGSRARQVLRFGWLALGIVCVGLGIVGALLPLMPTTIFLILAAGCFARSSPRLEARLLRHPRFGPTLRAWRRDGAMSRRAKGMACGGMAIGYAIFVLTAHPNAIALIMVAFVMSGCALYIGTRPTAMSRRR